jgi:ATP-dependent RNA helicase RhlE
MPNRNPVPQNGHPPVHAPQAAHTSFPAPQESFFGLGIVPKIIEILDKMKFVTPTPIQRKAIPLAIQGKDIIGVAQTGTGKTHSFAIPMVQLLGQKPGMGLVLAPTRELALQIDEAVKKLATPFGMRTACLIGGASMYDQLQQLRKSPRIVIATPGRLLDHLMQWHIVLDEVVMLVLDEADRMLDMGFAPQVDKILGAVPRDRQTMLFSATIPQEIMSMTARYMKLPVSVEIAPSGTVAERVTQELFIVKKEAKLNLLRKLLEQYRGSVLLFSRTRHNAHKIARSLKEAGFSSAEIHSDRSLPQRRAALEGFKRGTYRVLVATDIAARGIDVTGIELVINYDIPEDPENYVHRIGRTGRAGHKGHAISFATPDQRADVANIEKVIRASLPIAQHPEVRPERFSDAVGQPQTRRHTAGGMRRQHGGGGADRRQHGGSPFRRHRR